MTTELISSASDGTIGNSFSTDPVISADGRYVAFYSNASNLVEGDFGDIFLKNTVSGATTLISSASDGTHGNSFSSDPSISADGRYVAFDSSAANLVAGDTKDTREVFLKDTSSGVTTLISTASDGTQGNSDSLLPKISADGRYVAFESAASNLVPGDTNGYEDVFLKDTVSGVISLISAASNGTLGNDLSYGASISADGRYVAFTSDASNLVAGDTNNTWDIFLKDTMSGVTKLISTASDGTQGINNSSKPSISANGHYVVFTTAASNLVSSGDIFLKDTVSGVTTLISSASDGTRGNSYSDFPSISADGRYVAFESYASNLVAGDNNSEYDIFLKDVVSGAIALVSNASNGTQGNFYSYYPSISADGRYVTFQSYASNLVSGDTNNGWDVFRVNNPLYINNPSLTTSLSKGSLSITDFKLGGTANYINVKLAGNDLEITDTLAQFINTPPGGTLSHNNQTLTIPLASITGAVNINTDQGDDTVNVDTRLLPTILKQGLHINLGAGNDTLALVNDKTNNVWTINGPQAGQVTVAKTGNITFQGLENAAGGPGNDVYKLANASSRMQSINGNNAGGLDSLAVTRDANFTLTDTYLTIATTNSRENIKLTNLQLATLTGGAGNNFINAQDFTGPVRLNGGDGNDILWGGSGNDILNGGNGNDWLSGNGGADILYGWNGRDILVGGGSTGVDKLNGNGLQGSDTGDDLLIGGKTNFDTNKAAIDALLAAWASPLTYLDHIKQLSITGVGPAKQYKLNATTVFDDNIFDSLIGGTGNDWFFAGTSGTKKDTHDRSGFEQVVGV